jgi:hypothetical protein
LGYNKYIHGNVTRTLPVYVSKTKMTFFSFTKSESWRGEQVLPGGVCTSGRGRRCGKDVGG